MALEIELRQGIWNIKQALDEMNVGELKAVEQYCFKKRISIEDYELRKLEAQ